MGTHPPLLPDAALRFAFVYCSRCLHRWTEKGFTRGQREQLARLVVEDSDPDGRIAAAMLTAWGA